MKVKEITVSMSRTMNMGKYESARVETSFTAQLDAKDQEGPCATELAQAVAAHLQNHCLMVVQTHLPGQYDREQWIAHLKTVSAESGQ